MARPYKFRDTRTGDVIEFNWDSPTPPTRDDIDRIVSERTPAKPTTPSPLSQFGPQLPSATTPRFQQNMDPPVDTLQGPDYFGPIKRAIDRYSTPLMPDVEDDFIKQLGRVPLVGPALGEFEIRGATSPIGLATLGLGGAAVARAGLKRFGGATKAAKDTLPELEAKLGQALSKMDDVVPASTATRKPKYKLILDAEGRTVGHELVPEAVNVAEKMEATLPPLAPTTTTAATLPNNLRGSRPRFNIGQNSYEPQFQTDLDKAFFIVAQQNKNKRHADFIKFINENTGLDEAAAMAEGQRIRGELKTILKDKPLGDNKVPQFYTGNLISPQAAVQPAIKTGLPTFAETSGTGKNVTVAKQAYPGGPELSNDNVTKARKIIDDYEGVGESKKLNDADAIEYAEALDPGAFKGAKNAQLSASSNLSEAMEQAEAAELKAKAEGMPPGKAREFAMNLLNLPKSAWASYDLSAPLRQGKGLIHRPEYRSALMDMGKALKSEEGFFELQQRIRSLENYDLMKEYDPGLVGLKGGGLNDREEQLMSKWVENIPSLKSMGEAALKGDKSLLKPGMARSTNRAYEGFLNSLRADTFNNMIKNYEAMGLDPRNNPKLLDATSKFIASATGRGDIGKLGVFGAELNALVFSPRFVKSRFDMLLKPAFASMPWEVRKEYIKSLTATTSYWAGMAGLAHAAGAEVNFDPTNSDFGKIKIGDTRIDTLAGYQQPMVAMARFMMGKSTSPTTGTTTNLGEGYKADTRNDIALNFARTKMAPFAGLIYDAGKGRTISGKKTSEEMSRMDRNNYFLRMITPNLVSTMADLAQEENPAMLGLGIPAAFGESIQVFDPPEQQPARKRGATHYSRGYGRGNQYNNRYEGYNQKY